MAERKWSSPRMFLSLLGDKTKARRLERKARVLVGYLFDQLMPGQTYRTNNWRLQDGSMIKCMVWRDVLGERAQVKIWSPGGGKEKELLWYESGLLYWNPLANFYPLRVTIGDALKELSYPQPYIDGEYYESHYWLSTRPDIEFPDYLNDFYTDRTFWPSFWTGLARLAMQGLHAIARHPYALFSADMDPNRMGIVRDTAGNYWRIHITTSGVFSAKLSMDETLGESLMGSIALANFQAGRYENEHERNVLEARALACMNAGTSVEIASSSEVAAVLDEGFAVSYGWKFARNKLEASIVTFREECMPEFTETCIGQFVTSLHTIEFLRERDGNVYSLTGVNITQVTEPIRSRPRTGVTSIYVPSYGVIWGMSGKVPSWGSSIYPACCYASIGDTIQPQYCWYDKSDVLQVVWYVQYQDYVETHDTRPINEYNSSCSLSWSWSGEWGSFGFRQGGFHIGPTAPNLTDFRDGYYDYTEGSYSVVQSPGGDYVYEWDSPTTSDVNFVELTGAFCSGGDLYSWYQDHSPYNVPPNPEGSVGYVEIWAYRGTTSETLVTHRYSATPRAWSFVVSPHDAEAAYLVVTEKTEKDWGEQQQVISDLSDYTTDETPRPVFGGSALFKFYKTGGGGLLREETLSDLRRPTLLPGQYIYGAWYGYVFNIADYEHVSPVEEIISSSVDWDISFWSPSGEKKLPSDGYWPTLLPESVLEGTFIAGMPVQAMMSYSGDGLYYSEENTPMSIGGYPEYPESPIMSPITSFFIGGA